VKKDTVHLFGDSCQLLKIIKCPSTTKVAEQTKYKQFNGRTLFVVSLLSTPSMKQGVDPKSVNKLEIV
jgi:hypothetical protein